VDVFIDENKVGEQGEIVSKQKNIWRFQMFFLTLHLKKIKDDDEA